MLAVIFGFTVATVMDGGKAAAVDVVILKIGVNSAIISAGASAFPLAWPPVVVSMFQAYAIASASAIGDSLSADCVLRDSAMRPSQAWGLSMMIIPPAVVLLWLVVFSITSCLRKDWKYLRVHFPVASIVTFTFAHPVITKSAVKLLACRTVAGRTFLDADFNVSCSSEEYRIWAGTVAIPLLLVFTFGMPLAYWLAMYRHVRRGTLVSQRNVYGFFFSGFRKDIWWFELWNTLRKALFTISSVIFAPAGVMMQTWAALCLLMLFLAVFSLSQPYESPFLNRLERAALSINVLTLLSGLGLFTNANAGVDATSDELALFLTIFITGSNIFFVLDVLWTFTQHTTYMPCLKACRRKRREARVEVEVAGVVEPRPTHVVVPKLQMKANNRMRNTVINTTLMNNLKDKLNNKLNDKLKNKSDSNSNRKRSLPNDEQSSNNEHFGETNKLHTKPQPPQQRIAHPRNIGSNWWEQLDPVSGHLYYSNSITGATQWVWPDKVPKIDRSKMKSKKTLSRLPEFSKRISQQIQSRKISTHIQQQAEIAAAVHHNQMLKRRHIANQRLQQRLTKKTGTLIVPTTASANQPQYIPIPKYKTVMSSSSSNMFSSSVVLRRAREHVAKEEVDAIRRQSSASRQLSINATKKKQQRADKNLQKRLALRQRAKQSRVLTKCKPFAKLSEKRQNAIVDQMSYEKIEPGSLLCTQGAPADRMFVLMSGHCDVVVDKVHVATLHELDIFGESALFSTGENGEKSPKRTATVTSKENVEVLALSRTVLQGLVATGHLDEQCMGALKKVATQRSVQNAMLKTALCDLEGVDKAKSLCL